MDGWMGGCNSGFTDCLQQSKIKVKKSGKASCFIEDSQFQFAILIKQFCLVGRFNSWSQIKFFPSAPDTDLFVVTIF